LSSLHRAQVGPIVQNIMVDVGLGGMTSTNQYIHQKMASVKLSFVAENSANAKQDPAAALQHDPRTHYSLFIRRPMIPW
jgi:hypothetical protein